MEKGLVSCITLRLLYLASDTCMGMQYHQPFCSGQLVQMHFLVSNIFILPQLAMLHEIIISSEYGYYFRMRQMKKKRN